jgi:hypothetical protein
MFTSPVKLTDVHNTSYVQYCDLSLMVSVAEDYYLKLYPASFLRRIDHSKDGNQAHHDLRLDIYSSKEDMLQHGWRHFDTREAMEAAAEEIANQALRGITLRTEYTWKDRG